MWPFVSVCTFDRGTDFCIFGRVHSTPARSFRPFPPLSKVPFLGKRKPRQQWGGCCAPGTLWPCATERAGSGQPTQCAHRSCRETRAVAGNCAKAARAGYPHRGQPRPRRPRRGFGRLTSLRVPCVCAVAGYLHLTQRLRLMDFVQEPSHLAPAFPVPDPAHHQQGRDLTRRHPLDHLPPSLTFCTALQRRWMHPTRCLLSPDTPTCTVCACKEHSSRAP